MLSQGPFDVAASVTFRQRLTLVIQLLPPRQRYIDFRQTLAQHQSDRHQRVAARLDFGAQVVKLPVMNQQFARPVGFVVVVGPRMFIRRDVRADEPQLTILNARVCITQVDTALADRFDLCSAQDDARFDDLFNVVIVERLAIRRDDLFVAGNLGRICLRHNGQVYPHDGGRTTRFAMARIRPRPYNAPMSESFYRQIATWYDLEFDDHEADIDLYRGYAEIVGSPILELGCGTGRLLVPLAQEGYDVVGVDTSTDMLERARARLDAVQVTNAQIWRLDMRQLGDLPDEHFRLVFCAVNSFLHLGSREDQLSALRAAGRVLHHRGVLILDVFHPTPSSLQTMDDRLTLDGTWSVPDGSRIDRFSYRRVHPAQQLIETTLLYDQTAPDGTMRRTSTSYQTRYVHHFEMLGLLDDAGFALESVYGSYALDPLEDGSDVMIFVAHRR